MRGSKGETSREFDAGSPSPIDLEKLSACIHCGFCLPACPTHVLTGAEMPSPRGRLYLMRKVLDGEVDVLDEHFQAHELSCLVCRACETACPSGVEFGYLMEQTRDLLQRSQRESAVEAFFFRRLLTNSTLLQVLQTSIAFADKSGLSPVIRWIGKQLRGRYPSAGAVLQLLPAGVEFPKRRSPLYRSKRRERRGKVGLLLGCIGEATTARINDATIELLQQSGFDVQVFPQALCCGALQIHSGYRAEALRLATRLMDEVLASACDYFVSNIAGCGAMLKDYVTLFEGSSEAEKATLFRRRVEDINEFLSVRGDLEFASDTPLRIAYQAPCHLLHGQGIADAPLQLLRQIPSAVVFPLPENELCCGSAGTYNISHPEMSDQLLARKIESIGETQPDIVATANAGCLLQLEKGLRQVGLDVPVKHVVELLNSQLLVRK